MKHNGKRTLGIVIVVLVVALAAVIVAGCGGTSEETTTTAPPSSTTTASVTSTSEGTTSTSGASLLDKAIAETDANRAVPTFEAPGPAFDPTAAKGKKLFILDIASSIPLVEITDNACKDALALFGATVTRFDGKGSVTDYVRGINQAISDKVDAIALFAVNPELVTSAVQKALDAGIKIIVIQYGDPGVEMPMGLDAQVTYSYTKAGEMMGAWIAADAKGEAAGVMLIPSEEVPNAKYEVGGFTAKLTELAPNITVKKENIPVADWQTKIPTAVRSAITGDSTIKYVVPIYDGMALFAQGAIETAGRTDVKIVTYNGSIGDMQSLAAGKSVACEVGSPNAQEGWALADQFLRVVTGQPPLVDEKVGLRLFDATNIGTIDLTQPEKTWYGVDFESVYKEMWGL